jgi:uncharacterized integral membrane protein
MRTKLFGTLILALLILIFALQNNKPVEVHFFFARFSISLAILIFLVFVIGALLGVLTSLPDMRRKSKQIDELKKKIKDNQTE